MHVPDDLSRVTDLPVWLEVHVDDDVLVDHPDAWPESAALLDALATRAEHAGGVLCFRIRETFARGDRVGFLKALQARGHEVGWHAHGKELRGAVSALQAAGVRDAARVGAPGLVQVEQGGGSRWRSSVRRARAQLLLEHAQLLGLRVLTDRRVGREFGWQGRVPWVIGLAGGRRLTSIDVTADPFSWGVLGLSAGAGEPQVTHARGTLDWQALDALIRRREAEDRLPGSYFGATVHEHNFCAEGRLAPLVAALDAYERWLDRRGRQLVRAADLAGSAVDPGGRGVSAPGTSTQGVSGAIRRLRRVGQRAVQAAPVPAAKPNDGAPPVERRVQVDGRTVRSLWFGSEAPQAVVVVVHGGVGGCTQRLGFLGLADWALAAEAGPACTLVVFDRTEVLGGQPVARTPGNPVHVADTAAVVAAAGLEATRLGVPLRVLTWSGGLVPAVLSGLVGVERLVDVEGPVDRYSLVPPAKPQHELHRAEIFDDAVWAGREVLDGIEGFTRRGGEYVRVQCRPDHVHGGVDLHARAAILAAERGRGQPVPVGGSGLLTGPSATLGALALTALSAPVSLGLGRGGEG